MQKITPFLWFNENAEEAATFYTTVFPGARITSLTRYPDAVPGMGGKVLTVGFELLGQHFTGLNGGPRYPFTEAVSFVVHCEDQAEVDKYWDALSAGGQAQACGWLKDRYGLSWQIIPNALLKLMGDPDQEKSARVTQAMMQMVKIDVAALQKAYEGA